MQLADIVVLSINGPHFITFSISEANGQIYSLLSRREIWHVFSFKVILLSSIMAFDMIQTFLTFINSYLSFWFLSLLICSFTSLSSHLMQTPGTQCVNPNLNTALQFCLLQAIGADGQIVEMNMVHTFPANEGSRQLHFVCSVINWAQLWDCTAAIMPSHNPVKFFSLPLHFARMERNDTFLYVEQTVELYCDLLHTVNVRCHRGGEWAAVIVCDTLGSWMETHALPPKSSLTWAWALNLTNRSVCSMSNDICCDGQHHS